MDSAIDSVSVPLTLEGSFALHQMMRVRWRDWKALPPAERSGITKEACQVLTEIEPSQSALFSMLGHKGDLMFVHFRPAMADLNQVELRLSQTALWDFLEPTSSYVSVIELGLYESTQRVHRVFAEKGLKPGTEEWERAEEEELDRQRKAMESRLYPTIPATRYLCFYPMDRRRGEDKNWYQVPFAERARMMHEHGMVGRKYAGRVKQIISGSIGFDDWEWGVDLFADDPVQFKKLIYEMRFDEVSAVYALFGPFYIAHRVPPTSLGTLLLRGELQAG